MADFGAKESKWLYDAVKRIFDVLAALLFGSLFLIPMAVFAVWIMLDSPGPAIYRQERLGTDGKPFVMLKFRSMYLNAEQDGPRMTERQDRRCTPFGRMLRHTHLDELPQLWNILAGDMSFVGPRPERAFYYKVISQTVPDFSKRLVVRPGLTGLAQINGGYYLKPEKKLEYDLEYIQSRSIWMDLKCLIGTVRLLFYQRKDGT